MEAFTLGIGMLDPLLEEGKQRVWRKIQASFCIWKGREFPMYSLYTVN